jgi:hypothetical protein
MWWSCWSARGVGLPERIGTVVEADDQLALVEISDDREHALDFICVPHDVLVSSPGRTTHCVAS